MKEISPSAFFEITNEIASGGFYFVYVIDVHGKTAEAKWNEDPRDLHANAPLGTLTRNGACWENAIAQICAR